MPQAELISVGNELLNGRIADTNAQWLGRQLTALGIPLARVSVVPDDRAIMRQALEDALSRSEVVMFSGGLGPTDDDFTKPVLTEFFGGKLVLHEPTLAHLEALLAARGRTLNERNRGQAIQPDNASILANDVGTAPGLHFTTTRHGTERHVFAFPGVPYEQQHLLKVHVLPFLAQQFDMGCILQHTLRTAAIPESELATQLETIERCLPPEMFLAYNPGLLNVDLRLTLRCSRADQPRLEPRFHSTLQQMRDLLGHGIYGEQDETLAFAVGRLLKQRGWTIATAESCTGGGVGAAIVSVPGSSAYYKGGLVAYANEVKQQQLGVTPETLEAHGAVSQPTAEQMASGVARLLDTHVGISTTGIAGPDGGSAEKPVGLVWVGIHTPEGTLARSFRFESGPTSRERNLQRSVMAALALLYRKLA